MLMCTLIFFCNDINSYSLCIDFQPLYISYKIVSVFKFEEIVNRFKFAIEGVLRRIWCEEFKWFNLFRCISRTISEKILKNTKVFYLDSLSCSLLGNFCDIIINESHDCSRKLPTVIVF